MPRYIDADALIAYCDKNWIPLNVNAVNKQPTADVVEVVRCKDCKNRKSTKLHNDEWYCIHYRYPMYKQDLNGFCSHGEKEKRQ